MPGRVPVLGQDDVGEDGAQGVDDGNHSIAAGYAQRAAGTEIILNIDGDQGVTVCRLDNRFSPVPSGASGPAQRLLKATEKPLRMRISMHCPLRFSM